MEENAVRVREGFEAFNRGDMGAVVRFLHPDVEVHASEEVGEPGTYQGREGFVAWNGAWMDAWDDFQAELIDLEPVDDENVLVFVHQSGRGRGSGLQVSQDVVYLFTLREGKAVRLHLYADRESALKALES